MKLMKLLYSFPVSRFMSCSIPTHVPSHRINAGANGCMGVAVPYGLGAKVAKPDKQVIVLSGDGSFGFVAHFLLSSLRFSSFKNLRFEDNIARFCLRKG